MKNKLLLAAVLYYSMFVFISLYHFAAPSLESVSIEHFANTADKNKDSVKVFLAEELKKD